MRRTYKFLLRPTLKQAGALAACLEDHRQLYNAALEERLEAWRMRRVQAGEKPGYPRFKGRGRFDTVDWPAHKDGARWDSVPQPVATRVYLLGIGHVRVHQHRAVATVAALHRKMRRFRLDQVFLHVLHAKAEEAGRVVVAVDPRHTSQTCAEWGHAAAANRVTQALFRCRACGHQANADVNAALNILRAGLALRAAQAA